jgi:TonB family protein
VEVKPSYPGDMDAFLTFLNMNMHYPESAETDSIEGRVIVQFVVEKDGNLSNYDVLQSPDDRLTEEAMRVLRMMPRWQPGQQNGRKVRCRYKVPFKFRMK